jgi:hypothetical protein
MFGKMEVLEEIDCSSLLIEAIIAICGFNVLDVDMEKWVERWSSI